jgi:hypothetical protein
VEERDLVGTERPDRLGPGLQQGPPHAGAGVAADPGAERLAVPAFGMGRAPWRPVRKRAGHPLEPPRGLAEVGERQRPERREASPVAAHPPAVLEQAVAFVVGRERVDPKRAGQPVERALVGAHVLATDLNHGATGRAIPL